MIQLLLFPLLFGEWTVNTEELSEVPSSIQAIAVTEKGHLFFLDRWQYFIFHLDENGKEIQIFGKSGEGPGEMNQPYNLQYLRSEQQLFLTDFSKPEMLVFDLNGEPKPTRFKAGIESPLLIDSKRALVRLTKDPFTQPNQGCEVVVRTSDGKDIILIKHNSDDHEDEAHIAYKGATGILSFPWHKKVLTASTPDHKTIFIGSTRQLKFDIFHSSDMKKSGQILYEDVPRPPLTSDEIEAWPTWVGLMGKRFKAKDFDHPDFKPPVQEIMADVNGNLWVNTARAWENPMNKWLVFDQKNRLLGMVEIPHKHKLFHANDQYIWKYHTNEDGAWIIQKQKYQLKGSNVR